MNLLMPKYSVILSLAMSALLAPSLFSAGRYVNEYEVFSMTGLPGRLYVPPDAEGSPEPRPLILALHGGGAIGSNNTWNVWDFDELLDGVRERDAFIYAPQATSARWTASSRPENIMTMIDRLIEERNIDNTRIYVTGFSMGGGGAWDMLALYPDRFAAGLPVCSVSPRTPDYQTTISGKPIWAFHARDDTIVSRTSSQAVVNQILDTLDFDRPSYPNTGDFQFSEPGASLSYTEYATGGHIVWPRVYSQSDTIDWLFSQSQNGPALTPAILAVKLNAEAALEITLEISLGRTVEIEKSSDLIEWSTHSSLTGTDEQQTVMVPDLGYYYRAKMVE